MAGNGKKNQTLNETRQLILIIYARQPVRSEQSYGYKTNFKTLKKLDNRR